MGVTGCFDQRNDWENPRGHVKVEENARCKKRPGTLWKRSDQNQPILIANQ